jgi:hypothetical protein
MDPLALIRTTHEIDRHLAELSDVVTDDDLKKNLADFHAEWRELGYRVTANLCGLAANGDTAPKRRGRRRRIDAGGPSADSSENHDGAGS